MNQMSGKNNDLIRGLLSGPTVLFVLVVLVSTTATPARAAVIKTDNGGLNVTSIEDLFFDNMFFDVTFVRDTFNNVFGSGSPVPAVRVPYFVGDEAGATEFRDTIRNELLGITPVPKTVNGEDRFHLPYSFSDSSYDAVGLFATTTDTWDTFEPRCSGSPLCRTLITENWMLVNEAGPVPEPGSAILFGLGLGGLAWARRKRNGKPHLPTAA